MHDVYSLPARPFPACYVCPSNKLAYSHMISFTRPPLLVNLKSVEVGRPGGETRQAIRPTK